MTCDDDHQNWTEVGKNQLTRTILSTNTAHRREKRISVHRSVELCEEMSNIDTHRE
jgi:hypothetical protein